MAASISASAGGTSCAPSDRYTLYPLSRGGLWLAVTMTPAAAPCARTACASTGVGSGRGSTSAGRPAPVATRAVSAANSRDPCRASYPITSGPGASRTASQVTSPAAAWRTTARFIPFGPARSGPRRPAVPNRSGPANRSARSAPSPSRAAAIAPRNSSRVAGSGSSSSQRSAVARRSSVLVMSGAEAVRANHLVIDGPARAEQVVRDGQEELVRLAVLYRHPPDAVPGLPAAAAGVLEFGGLLARELDVV